MATTKTAGTTTARAKMVVNTSAGVLYATPTGVKLGATRNPVQPVAAALGTLPKFERRRARRALRAAGFTAHAAAPGNRPVA